MHTVIVGGGIAGIKAAREISRRGVGKVTLVSQESDFIYHDMLYAAATGSTTLDPVAIADIFSDDRNVTVVQATLDTLDVERKQIICGGTPYPYDTLILALGASVNFFNIPGADHHSFSLETLKKANELRRHIHDDIAVGHHLDKHYVIVGGGLTGVELAGTMGAYIRKVTTAHQGAKGKVKVLLVEQEERLLPLCSRTASAKAAKRLKKLGVATQLGKRVESLTGEYVVVDGKKISTETVIWTCGSRGNAFFAGYPQLFKTTDDGRVVVDSHLQACDNIFVIGDSAAVPYGGRVSSALREASYVAHYLGQKIHRSSLHPYNPRRAATCLRIGDNWAYVEKYGIYAAGATGYMLFRLHERFVLETLLPSTTANQFLHTKTRLLTDCRLCDT